MLFGSLIWSLPVPGVPINFSCAVSSLLCVTLIHLIKLSSFSFFPNKIIFLEVTLPEEKYLMKLPFIVQKLFSVTICLVWRAHVGKICFYPFVLPFHSCGLVFFSSCSQHILMLLGPARCSYKFIFNLKLKSSAGRNHCLNANKNSQEINSMMHFINSVKM